MTITRTHVRAHVHTTFANPHLHCARCRRPVASWHDSTACGCGGTFQNGPCGCETAGVVSVCPSWSPVDGCTCTEPHREPK